MRLLFILCLFASTTLFGQSDSLITDTAKVHELSEVVVTASKQEEKLLQSPVSIEKLELKDIRQSAQPSFFDAIENLKGIQMITPSLGFKVINARGFTNTTNVRFVQMVDGMDNQAPHIGAPIANSLGPIDLDINKVEIIPGSASAVYGMNAINGLANFITKDPFLWQGLSVQQKTGVNNVNNAEREATAFSETSLRYAKAFKNKFAFKINGAFMKGTDWTANNRIDLNPAANTSTGLLGENNPGKDIVNQYGDESPNRKTLTLSGKQYVVSRTGYAEKDATNYGLQNVKGDGSLFYKPTGKVQISYVYRFAYLNTVYQRTNRFRFDDYLTQQHGVHLKTPSIQFKTYLTLENTGHSYNIRSMAENIDRSFKSDDQWFKDYTARFNTSTNEGSSVQNAMLQARAFADNGRPQPGTDQYHNQISDLRNINNWDQGAALRVNARLYHAEAQHDLTQSLLPKLRQNLGIQLMYGLDFRNYTIIPDGNYFINPVTPGANLQYWKTGGFVQASKYLLKDKLKVSTVVRVDKNQYFDPKLNPRLAIVYSPVEKHNFRVAVQQGYRFPSIFEAFSNINSGGVKRVGGLPVMSSGIFENSYLFSTIQAYQSTITSDKNMNKLTTNQAITKNKGLIKKNSYTYIQPEQVTGIELGYRTKILEEKLYVDIDFYYNQYKNLMAQVEVAIPKTSNPDSIAKFLNDKTKYDRYRLWTNSKTVSYNYGGTLGLSYMLPGNYKIGGNMTTAALDRKDQQDGLEDGFNTPNLIVNIAFGNPQLFRHLGFNINYRWQNKFLWQSSLATGNVPAYSTVDAQLSYAFLKNKINLKIGASNLFNSYYYSFLGGPAIGAFYYCTVSYGL